MEIFWPAPQDHDTCALCNRVVDQSTDYVLTWDEAGNTLWWHMTCRDRMIPVLLAERDEVDARDEEI
jgi:hypothetical protein